MQFTRIHLDMFLPEKFNITDKIIDFFTYSWEMTYENVDYSCTTSAGPSIYYRNIKKFLCLLSTDLGFLLFFSVYLGCLLWLSLRSTSFFLKATEYTQHGCILINLTSPLSMGIYVVPICHYYKTCCCKHLRVPCQLSSVGESYNWDCLQRLYSVDGFK